MAYRMNTKVPYDVTEGELLSALRSWGATKIDISSAADARHRDEQGPRERGKSGWLVPRRDWFADERCVTVSFVKNGRPVTVSEDRHQRPADNLRVLFLCIDELRMIDARGYGEVFRTAYLQLNPAIEDDPWRVLGLGAGADADTINRRYRELARELAAEPERLKMLNIAKDAALRARSGAYPLTPVNR